MVSRRRIQHLFQMTHVCAQVASILALNPSMGPAEKRSFVRRFLKNAARPEEESRKLLDSGM
jgi:hypothetical protein